MAPSCWVHKAKDKSVCDHEELVLAGNAQPSSSSLVVQEDLQRRTSTAASSLPIQSHVFSVTDGIVNGEIV